MIPIQFRSRDLFAIIFVVALTLGLVSGESTLVAIATGFCLLSSVGLTIGLWISGRDLYQTLANSIKHRRIGLMGTRIKWLMFDGLMFVWLILAISVANFVLANYIEGARTLLMISLFLGPFIALVLISALSGSDRPFWF